MSMTPACILWILTGWISFANTSSLDRSGYTLFIRAMAPAASGVAMDVPLYDRYCPLGTVLMKDNPGARNS